MAIKELDTPAGAQYGVWMRAPSTSGGKDWIGFITNAVVISFWGKTDQVNQTASICDHPHRHVLNAKIQEKNMKGYRILGELLPTMGWTWKHGVTVPQQAPPPPLPQSRSRRAALPNNVTLPVNIPDSPPPSPPKRTIRNIVEDWKTATDGAEWF